MSDEMKTLLEAIRDFRDWGYQEDFEVENGVMKTKSSERGFKPYELLIEEIFRSEGESNPADMSVLYAISAVDGTKGIITDAYGIYENSEISDFIKKVKIKKP